MSATIQAQITSFILSILSLSQLVIVKTLRLDCSKSRLSDKQHPSISKCLSKGKLVGSSLIEAILIDVVRWLSGLMKDGKIVLF